MKDIIFTAFKGGRRYEITLEEIVEAAYDYHLKKMHEETERIVTRYRQRWSDDDNAPKQS